MGQPTDTPERRGADGETGRPERILFVCQNDFSAPSEKQVLGLAQQLVGRGHEVMIAICGDISTAQQEGATGLPGLRVHDFAFVRGRLRPGDLAAARDFAPTLVHAWNSRVPTIAAARAMARAARAPVFVHFEDDEWRVPEHAPGELLLRRVAHRGRRVVSHFDPSVWWHSNRSSLRWTARHAAGLDALTPALAREVQRRMKRDCAVVLPITPRVPPTPVESLPKLPAGFDGHPLLLITGTIWPVYLPDFMLGFRAVAELQRRGRPVRLLHAGRVLPRWDPLELARSASVAEGTAAFIGYVPFSVVPGLLRRADVLLQPGPPSEFNRLRLPSKLQAYLASGTPTVTFAVGFGELLADRVEVLLTQTADPGELADRIAELLDDPALRATLSRSAPAAAARLFDPRANADALLSHYRAAPRR